MEPGTRDNVKKAYEFALNHVGQDKDSGEIWSDYIQFLKASEVCIFACLAHHLPCHFLKSTFGWDCEKSVLICAPY
jgi:hypothetical protein